MRTFKLTLRYRGGAYQGFQVQSGKPTVCKVFQDAVEQAFGVRYDIKGCSRTDAGVHANQYVLSMCADTPMECWQMVRALNAHLPPDIAVSDVREAPEGFHARYDCTGKRYIYRIWNAPVRNPFTDGLAYHYFRPLDLAKAQAVCDQFVGRHDFAAFCGAKNKQTDTTRTITRCGIGSEGNLVTFYVEGDGFLYHMVRILVGTVAAVNENRLKPEEIPVIMEQRERRVECRTMPACGLYLDRVDYPDGL